jgi:GDP-mannose transporter
VTASGERLDEFSMVFYNNLLSLPLIFAVMVIQGELTALPHQPDLYNPKFLIVASLTGIVSFGISFSVLWFLSTTTPTTFSLVGSLNKIPVSVIGLILFESGWSLPNLASILVGLVSGVMFVVAKQQSNG